MAVAKSVEKVAIPWRKFNANYANRRMTRIKPIKNSRNSRHSRLKTFDFATAMVSAVSMIDRYIASGIIPAARLAP